MPSPARQLSRIRQVVLAARDLDPVANRLRDALHLGEPFADPGVEYFGLRNAVFALGGTFIEIASPARPGTAAGRLLARRGGDTGYEPRPPEAWRWGGPDWDRRRVPGDVEAIRVAVRDPRSFQPVPSKFKARRCESC